MATGAEIIGNALRKLGVIASGEDPSSAEQADALVALNQLLESWSNMQLFIFNDNEETFSLTGNKASYTMGTGADFDTSRPLKITNVRLKVNPGSNPYELPMVIYNLDEWSNIVRKSTFSSIPQGVYVDYTFPNVTINVYPVPTNNNQLIINSRKVLQNLSSAATSLTLPPGYARALEFNLACDLAPDYGITIDGNIMRIARESVSAIKRNNKKNSVMSSDLAVITGQKPFNWLSGE